jgi:formylglycine-generating enzyme required for sulfatase activity
VPDIVWCDVPAAEFVYGGDEQAYGAGPRQQMSLPPFHISKYPVTFMQFQAFIDADDGYHNAEWWQGLHERGITQQREGPGEQAFRFANHPRDTVSWYDAIAYCRWLTAKLGLDEHHRITLPTEQQWEKAARGEDGRVYPYGNEFDAAKGNTRETGIGQTSAVGIFPAGASPYGALDISGNVWEWTLTEWETGSDANVGSGAARVLRGGSWGRHQYYAWAASRDYHDPYVRYGSVGFRLASPASL